MKILILGVAGLVGHAIVDLLNNIKVHEFLGTDNLLYTDDYLRNVNFQAGNVGDSKFMVPLLKKFQPDAVIHLAGIVGDAACAVRPQEAKEANITSVEILRDHFDGRIIWPSSCYDENTQVLTSNGIKFYQDISLTDQVLTFNTQTRQIEWKNIKRIIIKDFEGELVHFSGRSVDLLVTPDHKMLIQARAKNSPIIYEDALAVSKRNTFNLVGTGVWEGLRGPSVFNVDAENLNDNFPQNISIEDMMYLMGLFIGDGFTFHGVSKQKNKTGLNRKEFLKRSHDSKGRFMVLGKVGEQEEIICNSYSTQFCIPEGDPARKTLINILKKYNVKYWTNKINVGISSKRLYNFFKSGDYGKNVYDKQIPLWALKYNREILLHLFNGLIDSDGHWHKRSGPNYTTTSKKLAEDLIELGIKVGYRPTISKVIKKKITLGALGYTWVVYFAKGRPKTISKRNINTKKYKGKVWCLEVEDNHNFLIIRNGKPNFCGNCSVYGSNENLVDESSPLNPLSLYAEMKVQAEEILKDKNVFISRLATLHGMTGRVRNDLVVNVLALRALSKGKITVFGGHQYRPLLHVRDFAKTIIIQLARTDIGIFNLVEDNYKIIDIANIVTQEIQGVEMEVTEMPFEDNRNYKAYAGKAKRTWGFDPELSVQNTVKDIVRIYNEGRVKDFSNIRYSNMATLQF